tara:strand:+ start:1351 stop:3636 length:2286 start_codon:yes stop_codon:yes gene_type:complete
MVDINSGVGKKALQFLRLNPVVQAVGTALRSTPVANAEITSQDLIAFSQQKDDEKEKLPAKIDDDEPKKDPGGGGPNLPEVINWLSALDNEAYKKNSYNNDQYLDAGASLDSNFSNIRAYLNMLPGNQEIKTADLLGELRRLGTDKYNETPFGKFYNPAELRESGFEFSLMKMINQDPNSAMTTTEFLSMFDQTDPKTKYQGFEGRISSTDALLQNYRVGLENLQAQQGGTKEFKDFKFQMSELLENQFKNLNDTLRGIPDDQDKASYVGKQIGDIGQPIYDQIKANSKKIKRLSQGVLPFNRVARNRDIAYLETQNQELNSLLSVVRGMAENTGFDTPVQQYLSAGQSNYSLGGGRNYQVKGLTFNPRDVPGFMEGVSQSTHFSSQFKNLDSFHVRSADYKDISGLDTTIIQEVQSDQEERRRKSRSFQDPSADLKINRIQKEIQDYTQNTVLAEMDKRNIDQNVLREIEFQYGKMMSEFQDAVKEGTGKITNLPSFDKYINEYLAKSQLEGTIDKTKRDEIYRFYKRIKPLYSLKNQLYNVQKKSGGEYSVNIPYASNPLVYAEQAIWQTSLDSLNRGINYVSWLPGEVQTQIQHGGGGGTNFANTEEVLEKYGKQAQGHYNFYGSAKNPENNTMYKAAENVVKKYDKMAEILGWENYESPVLYSQGNKFFNLQGDQFGSGREYENQPMLSQNQTKGKNPNLKEGYAFIDFTPMIESLNEGQKKQLGGINLNNFPSYKEGGQVGSPSLVSIEEVINGDR